MHRERLVARPPGPLHAPWDALARERLGEAALAADVMAAEYQEAADGARVFDLLFGNGSAVADGTGLLRSVTERFQDVPRGREAAAVRLRTSAVFEWAALGLEDLEGRPVACPPDGPFALAWWAPWCEDCAREWDEVAARAVARAGAAALVAAFAPVEEVRAFLAARSARPLVWREPSEKTETARVRTFHGFLRRLEGDGRKWGLPAWRELRIASGRFVVLWG